ncbi:MAG: PP2C family protein-serine/threonine phosphatase [Desulfobacterales bacterium]|jgi:sigma-B regulation protein RsbU (phosphoserine phosphatase)
MDTKDSGLQSSLLVMFRRNGRSIGWWQIVANLVGATTVTSYFVFFDRVFPAMWIQNTFYVVGIMFPFLAAIAFFFFNFWMKDLMRFLQLRDREKFIEAGLWERAQRKILNMPIVSALVSFFNWFLAAITMTTYSIVADTSSANPLAVELIEGLRVFIGCIIGGIITAAIIFFITEAKCRQIWPEFFPEGGLARTPGVFRLRLRTRMFVIFVLASILPLILMAVLSYNKASMMLEMDPGQVIESLLYLTAFLLVITLAVAIILSRSFSTGIIDPIRRMEASMAQVEKGDLTATFTVNSNDELGTLGENFNQMTEGLKDRYRLRQSLDLAKEVQQNLLPAENPHFPGLDIAGKSIYCDETGGDYFDFFDSNGGNKYGVVIGDVSDHGIPSALLMASARAFLRQRTALSGSIADIVGDVNRQLTEDVEDTGRFITLFYLQIDMEHRRLSWVRAGHEPALLFDSADDRFEELAGEGIALGVDGNWRYAESRRDGLGDGQIVLLSTDGIWEARNPQDQMFGRPAVSDIIRQHAHASAANIQDAILTELNRFQQGVAPADDITLVVIKVRGQRANSS